MREAKRNPLRILHMLEAMDRIQKFMDKKELQDLIEDEILFFAVVKNIEIIGEAAFMLTKEFRDRNTEIPWREIIGMRHVLVHDYYHVSPKEVYKVVREDLPGLSKKLNDLRETL